MSEPTSRPLREVLSDSDDPADTVFELLITGRLWPDPRDDEVGDEDGDGQR